MLALQVQLPVDAVHVLPVEQVPVDMQLWQVPSVPQRYAPQTSEGFVVQLGWQIPTESSVVTLSQTYPERHSPVVPGVHAGKQMLIVPDWRQMPLPMQGSPGIEPASHA